MSGFRTTNKMKQNADVSGKSKASPEVHGVLLTLAGGAGSIRRPVGSPAASSPLSCEIVCDRPDPEASASSSQEVSTQPSGPPLAHPRQVQLEAPCPLGMSLTGAGSGSFSWGREWGLWRGRLPPMTFCSPWLGSVS